MAKISSQQAGDFETVNGVDIEAALGACEKALGYRFKDRSLLRTALSHASGTTARLTSNERLEFLGDAILGMVVCEELFRRFPNSLEGELTKIKSVVVSRRTCAAVSKELGLGEVILIGKGMMGRSSLPMSLLAAVLEALIAAVYLDSTFKRTQKLIVKLMDKAIDESVATLVHRNFKSQLQQYAQRELDLTPIYEILDEKGPDHSKCFEICVRLGDHRYTSAWGPSKKEAEQDAAKRALEELDILPATPEEADAENQ